MMRRPYVMETDLVSQRARLAQFSEPGASGLDDLERELKPAGLAHVAS
ncbi:MAG: hypothetical protein JWO23_1074 [Solirubrobacterales bacterium]|jgi:hypothetical protein|nr:hypothetical protein [Solirubrobacterales bacterium]